MSAPAIELAGLSKHFGSVHALDGVDLLVPEGSVFGFLGPNGAGKTTTLRVLTGLARPTSGTAAIFGDDVTSASNAVRARIGYLPDVPGFYGWMTAAEFLRFCGSLFGLAETVLEDRIAALLDLAGLSGVDARIGGFSRGMKQRLGVAQALVNAPRLLMLDEPTSALDPMGRKDVLEMIGSLRGKTTVFFSTHILTDVERVCDTVAVLDKGRVVRQATMDELKSDAGERRLRVEVTAGADELARSFAGEPWAVACDLVEGAVLCTTSDVDAARRAIPAAVAAREIGLVRMDEEEPSLEEVFVELVGGERP